MTDTAERTSESAVAPSEKRRVKVTMTRTMWVDVPAEEAEWLLDRECDITTHADHVTRWLRIAGQGYEFLDSWLELEDGSEDWPRPYWAPDVVDGAGRERYLWSARHFLGQARYELSCASARERNEAMKHARADYDARIQDSAGLIPDDEPVLLIRGQDQMAVTTIEFWIRGATQIGVAPELLEAMERHRLRIMEWQGDHGNKVPDAPAEALT